MSIKLSHSKASRYQTCPKSYDFHYNKRIRSKYIGSPLFFGCAIDEALNCLLLTKKKVLTEDEKQLLLDFPTPDALFIHEMSNIEHNNVEVALRDSLLTTYSKADLDLNGLSEDDIERLTEEFEGVTKIDEFAVFMQERLKSGEHISDDYLRYYSILCWECLRAKGEAIIKTYEAEIMPLIEEVFTIQEKVHLPNEEGDEIIGYIDFTCKFFDDDNVYVGDNKTSATPYKPDRLTESEQLHTYAEYKELGHIAYIVMEKNIRKRDPKVRINILKGEINEETTEKTFDNLTDVLYGIREENFEPIDDMSVCRFQYGKRCIYYDLCHNDRLGDKVVVVPERVK